MDFFNNQFLFSETYLREYIRQQKKAASTDLAIKYRVIKEWHDECDERNWFRDYIRPVIDTVGFKYPPIIKNTAVLYTNTPSVGDTPVAVLYATNKDVDLNSNRKGRYYAYETVSAAKANGVDWAMLTNGYQWRIYNAKNVSPYENYLEVNIKDSIINGNAPDEAFSLFHLFFNASTYYRGESGELVIEGIKDKSDETAEQVEELLRGKAEEILKDICYGFKETMQYESYDRVTCRMIYQDAISLLFRMLFFGYAESRGLLPRKEEDSDYKQNSFFKLCAEAKDILNAGKAYDLKNGFDFWNRLDEHLRIYVDQTYNGGLFSNDDKPVLREYKVANGWIMKCLAEIAYKKDKKTNVYREKIEYKDLSVRNLGSIYEGLLEFNLFIAEEEMVKRTAKNKTQYFRTSTLTLKKSDEPNLIKTGDIYLSQDATERKDTGSYYTPKDVVEYIVSNTVGKKMEELKAELGILLQRSYEELAIEPTESGRKRIQQQIDEETLSFIENKNLSLSIIDSAMGSGHFLVNATYKVANGIVEILGQNNWETEEEIHVDVGYWKRKVVENCIYGIDINALAVTLTKLSLWLISANNDKALSFLDHHLKEGNSIVGTDRYHVKTSGETGPIFDVSYEEYIAPIKNKYAELSRVGSLTKEDVERQKEIYSDIESDLELIKKKYDYFLASQYTGGIKDEDQFGELLRSQDIADFEQEEKDDLWQLAAEKKFFHWELEFPEVLLDGGFDIAIGNPPYVEVNEKEYIYSVGEVAPTRNLYAYMIANNLKNLRSDGMVSFIVLMALVASKKMNSLREILLKQNGDVYFLNIDSATHPGRVFKKLDIRLTVVTVHRKDTDHNQVFSTNYIRFFQHGRKRLFAHIKYGKVEPRYLINGLIPKIGNQIEHRILEKIYKKTDKNIGTFINREDCNYSIYYRNTGIVYYCIAFDKPPYYTVNGIDKISSTLTKINTKKELKDSLLCLFHSSLFYWFWTVFSDCHHFTANELNRFPMDLIELNTLKYDFVLLYDEIFRSQDANKELVTYNQAFGKLEYHEYRHRYSKKVFDKVDYVLADYYGLDQDEIEFIINYDIKYRID
ncbi:MAG: Eco57I restriction-modification methylase domain-containing protein [Clostridia bacterium]|nr:Eco57I restriction-modification methylase domain-containing protein [Clostridia bacterium]